MRLASVCSLQSGYTARSGLEPVSERGVPAIQLRDISADGSIDPGRLTRVELEGVPERYLAGAGDVIFRSRGAWNTASVLDDRFTEPAVAVLPLLILRPGQGVIAEYLAWAINQPRAQRYFDLCAQGGSLRMVPKGSLDELDIDVPDLPTQRRIVAVAELAAREELLAKDLAAAKRRLINHQLAECAQRAHAATAQESRT